VRVARGPPRAGKALLGGLGWLPAKLTLPSLEYARRPSVAVGTVIAHRPPHRSQRAALPHWAPALGQDAEPHIRKWVPQARAR
jgi:hypothetical protein